MICLCALDNCFQAALCQSEDTSPSGFRQKLQSDFAAAGIGQGTTPITVASVTIEKDVTPQAGSSSDSLSQDWVIAIVIIVLVGVPLVGGAIYFGLRGTNNQKMLSDKDAVVIVKTGEEPAGSDSSHGAEKRGVTVV